jgi:bifunctional DNA-binding transcriptional regulator/antitoxin component of YhaV-PrlF toxin-antitoxin module
MIKWESGISEKEKNGMASVVIQMRKKGTLTFPVELRNKYGLNVGDVFTLIDLGDGTFLLTPRVSQINRLGDRVAEKLRESGVSLDELLQTLDEERERYYQEHYAGD